MSTIRENASRKEVDQLTAPASVTASFNSGSVDTKGCGSCSINISVGDVDNLSSSPPGDGSWTFALEESDDDSIFTAIADAARVITSQGKSPMVAAAVTTGIFLTLDEAAVDYNKDWCVGVITNKRYVRVAAVAVSTPGASLIGISAIKEHLGVQPASN